MRPSLRQDWFAAIALLAGLFAAYAVPAATTGASAARGVAALALGALIALAVARAPFTFAPRIRTAFVLLIALALWYIATRIWAVDPAGSMVESSRVSAFVLLAWASHTTVGGTGARRLLLAGAGACGAILAAPLVLDFLRDGTPTDRVGGELGYWNATSIVALALVPAAVALAGSARRPLIALAAALVPIAGIAAVATASRGALVALVVALIFQAVLDPDYRGGLPRAFMALISLGIVVAGLTLGVNEVATIAASLLVGIGGFGMVDRRRARPVDRTLVPVVDDPAAPAPPVGSHPVPRHARRVGLLLVGAIVVLLLALVVDANRGALEERDRPDAARLATTDDSSRYDWWQVGIDIWQRAPIIGEGGGAFAVEEIDGTGGLAPNHVHSMPLEVLLETGLVGFLLLIAASIQFLRVLRRGRRTVERALGGAIAALLISQSLIDWTLSFPQVLGLLAIAGPVALQPPPDAPEPELKELHPGPAMAMLASLAIATTVAFTPMLASLLVDQAAGRFDAGKPNEAAELSGQSYALVPTIEALSMQVVSLQADGRADEARDVLRSSEKIWFTRREGLVLAQGFLEDDPKFGSRIERRLRTLDQDRASALA